MLGFIKDAILGNNQKSINKLGNVNIVLHRDMPQPSIAEVVEAAKTVSLVNALEPKIKALSDADLRKKTEEFKQSILNKQKELESEINELEEMLLAVAIPEEKEKVKAKLRHTRNKAFEAVLPEAFAVVREAARRMVNMRHFDVQIVGGIILHAGNITEMATGEGKTLVATLPAYLNALLGKGVHIVTVNDYLARRDREWMGPIYESLGLTVGTIQHDMSDEQRKAAYACDITYGTNNEFGFDYLRDNMKYSFVDMVQRPFYYAIVDEVDSILVDEARTPLIISGPAEESTEKYYVVDKIIPKLKGKKILESEQISAKHKGEDLSKGFDYVIDEKAHTAHLTEEGEAKACQLLNIANLHEIETMEWRHHLLQALKAHNLYEKDVEYVIKDGEVIIVDEFTGRMMPGRRWSDGLHQAVEAKEGLKIERENQTLATITFQNYFRMYEKLSGMTGTAFTEATEFETIYKLDVVVIPTNRPLIRANAADCVYKSQKEKFNAIVEEIAELYAKGQPVLVGTITIDKSEHLSQLLKRRGVTHQVLNAKYHEIEAQIVAQAGRYKAVTIATNMAGRGTDILLGGNPDFIARSLLKQQEKNPEDENYQEEYKKALERFKKQAEDEHKKVVELGGLHVLGTERHEARRIDNQLRGRCGRQGDPGSSRFYVALEDDLMRLFGSERLIGIMERLGLEEGQVIEHPLVSRSIEIAQRRVEQHNFEIRKQLLDYDNIMNKQREVIYSQRRQVLDGVSLKEEIQQMAQKVLDVIIGRFITENQEEWDEAGLLNEIRLRFGIQIEGGLAKFRNREDLRDGLYEMLQNVYNDKENKLGQELMRHLERTVLLQIIDMKWKDHLYAMDTLREGIGLRAYGQRDPLVEYKREAFNMFQGMIESIKEEAVDAVFKIQPQKMEQIKGVFSAVPKEMVRPEVSRFTKQPAEEAVIEEENPQQSQKPITANHVGRNDPCPCGSGKKYKKCHGQ